MISPTLQRQYMRLHESKENYGHSGSKHLAAIINEVRKCSTILDYGCGKGNLVRKLTAAGYNATGYDPAVPKFQIKPKGKFDMVISTDVLEHVEPLMLAYVLQDIRDYARHKVYLAIALRYDRTNKLPDGSNPHKIVKPSSWWTATLTKSFTDWEATILQLKENYEGVWLLKSQQDTLK
jgi:SAM-dependent methyltransferase